MTARTIPSGWWKDSEYGKAHFYEEASGEESFAPACFPSPLPDQTRDRWLDLMIPDPLYEDPADLPLPGTDMGRAKNPACSACVAKVLP